MCYIKGGKNPIVGQACVSGHKNEMCSQASSGCIWWPASKADWEALHSMYGNCKGLVQEDCKGSCKWENECMQVEVTGNNTIKPGGNVNSPQTGQSPKPNTTEFLSCMMPMKVENGTATCMHQSAPEDCVSGCEKAVFKTDCGKNTKLCSEKCATCEHGTTCAKPAKGSKKQLRNMLQLDAAPATCVVHSHCAGNSFIVGKKGGAVHAPWVNMQQCAQPEGKSTCDCPAGKSGVTTHQCSDGVNFAENSPDCKVSSCGAASAEKVEKNATAATTTTTKAVSGFQQENNTTASTPKPSNTTKKPKKSNNFLQDPEVAAEVITFLIFCC